MFQNSLTFTAIATLFIYVRLTSGELPDSVPSSEEIENIRYADSMSFSSGACTQFVASMLSSHGKRKGPVCRSKLVLI